MYSEIQRSQMYNSSRNSFDKLSKEESNLIFFMYLRLSLSHFIQFFNLLLFSLIAPRKFIVFASSTAQIS